MKFLAIGKPKDTLTALPPAIVRKFIEMTLTAIKQLKKEGKLLEAYVTPSGYPVVILDYKSVEDWIKDLNLQPILTYYDQEIYPLADMEDSVKSNLEALKAAEKMMPK
jgi:hypothetical protein